MTLVTSYEVPPPAPSIVCSEEWLLTPRGDCNEALCVCRSILEESPGRRLPLFQVAESANISYWKSSTTNRKTTGLMDGHLSLLSRGFPAFLRSLIMYQSKILVIVIEEVLKACRKRQGKRGTDNYAKSVG